MEIVAQNWFVTAGRSRVRAADWSIQCQNLQAIAMDNVTATRRCRGRWLPTGIGISAWFASEVINC